MRKGTVALVGRPNVGKSTLFNRIVGGRRAIVHDLPGVTRDRNFAMADWAGHHFWLVDTGGWIEGDDDPVASGIREQVTQAVAEADVVVFVVDTMQGVHPADQEVADLLRPVQGRVVVAANKADDLPNDLSFHAFHELGLGNPEPVSATTGKGSGDLLDRIVAVLGPAGEEPEEEKISVAVVGKPNVGKSSIANRLLGAERSIVAPEAGTTRDAIDSPLRYQGVTLNFIDTAGLRKRPKVKDDIEFYSTLRTERAIDRADVCVLVVDGSTGIQTQDLKVAQLAWKSGKGLIVAVNKWDLVLDKETDTAERGRRSVTERVAFLEHVPFVYVSALTGQRVRKLLDEIIRVAEARARRIPTAEVNKVLAALTGRNQPPQKPGREVKLLYASQVASRPPTFAVVTNRPDAVPEAYERYMKNAFYAAWDFLGAPLRVRFRRRKGTRR